MHKYLNFNTFISEILMYSNPTVIVEGLSDVLLIDTLFNLSDSRSSKVNVLSPEIRGININRKGIIIQALDKISTEPEKKKKKIIGIVDSDFNQICGNCRIDLTNLFYTDYHDFDTLIFSTNAFIKFIKFCNFNPESIKVKDVRDLCVNISKEYGYYFLSFYENNFHKFKQRLAPIDKFIHHSMKFNFKRIDKVLSSLLKNGKISKTIYTSIYDKIEERKKQTIDPYQIVNGHDLIRVLMNLILLEKCNLKKKGLTFVEKNRIKGNKNLRFYFLKELENLLRICYEFIHFKQSELYKNIKNYQLKHRLEFLKDP